MEILSFIPAFIILAFNLSFAQNAGQDNRIVAKAGSYKITAEEFKDRLEFSPHPRSTGALDTALVKKEFLYTLIAEKLLAR